jgi:hypothetical protein
MSDSAYLDEAELAELTGYRRRSKQVDWLRANAWIFALTSDNRPRVLRSYRDYRLSGIGAEPAPVALPNFEAI